MGEFSGERKRGRVSGQESGRIGAALRSSVPRGRAALLQQQSSAQEQIGAETARMREELTELAADVRALRERDS